MTHVWASPSVPLLLVFTVPLLSIFDRFSRPARRSRSPFAAQAAELEARTLLSGVTAAVDLTASEQYLLELVNRSRLNPEAEATRQGVAINDGLRSGQISDESKAPLAANAILYQSAVAHGDDMIARDYFAHDNPDGLSPTDRVKADGYLNARGQASVAAGENLNLIARRPELDRSDLTELVNQHHAALWASKSHRPQILIENPMVSEVGIAIRDGEYTPDNRDFDAQFVVQKFGVATVTRTYITGVVFVDSADGAFNNNTYNIGEGWGRGRVLATNIETGEEFIGQLNSAGGYNIEVGSTAHTTSGAVAQQNDALYRVTVQTGQANYTLARNVGVTTENVKVDFNLDSLTPDPPPDPEFAGRAVVRVDGNDVRWSHFADGEWYDASVTLAGAAVRHTLQGDFDGDGDLDVAVQQGGAGKWTLVARDGRESVVTANFADPGAGAVSYSQLHAGDFDGDGTDDIAVYNEAAGQWQVAITGGDGFANWQTLGSAVSWVNSRVGDFNGDGRDDIAIQENGAGKWYFMESNGSRFVTDSWGDSVNINIRYSAIESGDVDGDGRDELLMLNSVTGFWLVGFVNQEETFETWARWTTEAAWTNVIVADFNGDGRDDIAAQTGTPGEGRDGVWYVAPSVINENVTPEQVRGRFVGQKWSDRWNPEWGITSVAAADVDGDGRADLIGRSATGGSFLVGRSTGDPGTGFEFGTLAGLTAERDEIDILLAGDRPAPQTPLRPADA